MVGVPHARLGQLVAAVSTDAAALAAARAAAPTAARPGAATAAVVPRRPVLPLTAAGKVDRAAIAELAGRAAPVRLPVAPVTRPTRR